MARQEDRDKYMKSGLEQGISQVLSDSTHVMFHFGYSIENNIPLLYVSFNMLQLQ